MVNFSFVLQLIGALCFGVLIGWYLYYINRYRKEDIKLSDLVTLIGAIGGGAALALFPEGSDLYGAYGIGLAVCFFGYYLTLLAFVKRSKCFDVNWFLDGRRKLPDGTWYVPQAGEHPFGGIPMVATSHEEAGKKPPGGTPMGATSHEE